MNTKQLRGWVAPVLIGHGFRPYKGDWYNDRGAETVALVALQKPPYGGQYYLELGLEPRILLGDHLPRWYQFDFRVRLNALVKEELPLSRALDLEDPQMQASERESVIMTSLEKYALPLFKKAVTVDGIREIAESHPARLYFMISRELQGLFGRN